MRFSAALTLNKRIPPALIEFGDTVIRQRDVAEGMNDEMKIDFSVAAAAAAVNEHEIKGFFIFFWLLRRFCYAIIPRGISTQLLFVLKTCYDRQCQKS